MGVGRFGKPIAATLSYGYYDMAGRKCTDEQGYGTERSGSDPLEDRTATTAINQRRVNDFALVIWLWYTRQQTTDVRNYRNPICLR